LATLVDSENNTDASPSRPRRKSRRWLLLAALLVALFGALAWLNGPGLRWLAPMAASRFLEKLGMRPSFVVEGRLSSGFTIKSLKLSSDGSLATLSVDRIKPLYQFSELLRGRVRGIEIDGAHVDLRLGLEKPEDDNEPPDLEKIVQSLRQARGQIVPFSIVVRDLTLNAGRDGKPFLSLGKSALDHAAGAAEFKLSLGPLTDASGREWPAQQATLIWGAEEILLDRLDPLPGVGLRDVLVSLPETGGPAAELELHLNEAVFVVNAPPGLTSIGIDLREGRLDSRWLAERFALELPATAELTSLSVTIDDLLPDPQNATGTAGFLLENVVAGDWAVPELSVDLGLQADRAKLAASGRALDTGFSISAGAPLSREGGAFTPGDVRGQFQVEDVPALVSALSGRIKAIDPQATVPPSVVDGQFTLALEELRPARADVDLVLKPLDSEEASPLAVKARWQEDGKLGADIEIDGMKATAGYDLTKSTYEAKAVFDDFKSARIDRWLQIFKAGTRSAYALTGKWQGSGGIKSATHRGDLSLAEINFAQDGRPPIQARGDVSYDWPAGLLTKNLTIQTADQTVAVDVRLADGQLELSKFLWLQDGREIAKGSAVLPAPADFTKWRETLAHDTRPLMVDVESGVLPLELLKDWLPAASRMDPRSTGRVSLKVSGTYAEPEIDAVLEAKDLRSPEQANLPPADLRVVVSARDHQLTLEGNATSPDLPAATFTASMPFRPATWAENPGSVLEENLTARVDLPRLDLARYASLVPVARRLAGVLTGHIEVAGVVGKPEMKGSLALSNGLLELKQEQVPVFTGIAATADLTLDRVVLRELRADIAGGSLRGAGSLEISDGKPGNLDFRLIGRHVPVLRDDSMIVRAHADLRLAGAYETASLTGSVSVVDSLFYRDIEILPIGVPFTTPNAAALPRIDPPPNPAARLPEPFASWPLDLRVRTERPFLIRGNFASGRVDGDLRLRGTIGNPLPDGEVRIRDLRAALPFSTLTVKSGTLRFTPETGFDPLLEIRGTSNPRPYRVNGYVYGRASDPQLVLTSSPPLPENEIMTLLATGTTTSGLENPQAASSRAMQLLAEELRRGRFGVGRQLRPLLGLLDRVDFALAEADPYSNDSYSTAMLSITDRWYLSAGIGEEGDSRFLVIWRLTFH
jgi:hypothetical protein